jgi:hypothetical protein
MNRFAYRTTGLAIKALSGLSRARAHLHGESNIPSGSLIFVLNHFTRIETLLVPYLIHKIVGVPVWSLPISSRGRSRPSSTGWERSRLEIPAATS